MSMAPPLYRLRFGSFMDFAFRELHPGEILKNSWYIEFMAEVLQLNYQEPGQRMNRLIFNLPPGYLKTHICSVSFPAWILGRDPRKSVLILSEHPDAAFEIQERCFELMSSSRYRAIFPRATIKKHARMLELCHGGGIRHAGMGYHSHHKKSDVVIIDNPQSLYSLDRIKSEHLADFGRLLKKPKEGMMVMATRRLGENDLSSLLSRDRSGWHQWAFPAAALHDRDWRFPPDIRCNQKKGDLLNPGIDSWADLETHLHEMGGEAFCFQYLQGLHFPSAETVTETHEKDGQTIITIREPSSTETMMKFLNEIRAESKHKPLCMT